MVELRQIETGPGLTFDALVDGHQGAPLVLLLHGFAESLHMWRAQMVALAEAGYRAVAPSQRGYSPGARPDTADPMNYHFDRLVASNSHFDFLRFCWVLGMVKGLGPARGGGGGQGGRGGGFANARVWSRSSHEGKMRKVVIAARLLKNWLREACFCLAERQRSSAMSQTV